MTTCHQLPLLDSLPFQFFFLLIQSRTFFRCARDETTLESAELNELTAERHLRLFSLHDATSSNCLCFYL